MIKFAKNRVAGWNTRHLNQLKVARALTRRIELGYTLDLDEQQFLGDVQSLLSKYHIK